MPQLYDPGLIGLPGEVNELADDALNWRGTWTANLDLRVNDRFSYQGSSYITLLPCKGITPPNSTYYGVLANKGDAGATGSTGATGAAGTNGINATTTTTANFNQPVVGSTVTISVASTAARAIDEVIYIPSGGRYEITAVNSATSLTIRNPTPAWPGNATSGTTVNSGAAVIPSGIRGETGATGATGSTGSAGANGVNAFTTSTSSFVQPSIGATVTVPVVTSAWASVGQNVFIEGGGTYQITAIGSSAQITVQNLSGYNNTSGGSTISTNAKISPGGFIGPAGASFTTTSADFTQPSSGATVAVSVVTTSWMAIGQTLFIQGGGYYTVSSIVSSTSVTVTNPSGSAYSGNSSPGATIASGAAVSSGGVPGPTGATGADGVSGYGLRYQFSTTTTPTPSTGTIRFNNAEIASVTEIYVHETDRLSGNVATALALLIPGSSVQLILDSSLATTALFTVNTNTDNGSDRTLGVTYVSHSGSFSNTANVSLGLAVRGATGATGSTGTPGADGMPGYRLPYTFSSTTTSGPSTGTLRLNNATIASVTQVFIHETDRNSAGVALALDSLIAGSQIQISRDANQTQYALFSVGTQVDNGSDRTINVTFVGASTGTAFSNAENVSIGVAPRGAIGAGSSASVAIFAHQVAQNTFGGAVTTGSWQTRTITTEISDPDGIASISSNVITLAAGTYEVQGGFSFNGTGQTRLRLYDDTAAAVISTVLGIDNSAASGYAMIAIAGRFTISASSQVRVQYRCSATPGNATGQGAAMNTAGELENYGHIIFRKVA